YHPALLRKKGPTTGGVANQPRGVSGFVLTQQTSLIISFVSYAIRKPIQCGRFLDLMKDFIVFGDLGRTDLLFLSTKGRTRGLQLLLLLRVDRRVSEVEFLYRFHNGRGDKKSGKPFVISWHHVPRCAVRRRSPNCFLECVHVVAPKLALLHVRGREFPAFVWSVE